MDTQVTHSAGRNTANGTPGNLGLDATRQAIANVDVLEKARAHNQGRDQLLRELSTGLAQIESLKLAYEREIRLLGSSAAKAGSKQAKAGKGPRAVRKYTRKAAKVAAASTPAPATPVPVAPPSPSPAGTKPGDLVRAYLLANPEKTRTEIRNALTTIRGNVVGTTISHMVRGKTLLERGKGDSAKYSVAQN